MRLLQIIVNVVSAAAAIVLALPDLAQSQLEVITLKYRTAAELVPLIRPLAGRDGAVSGLNNQLVVRASPEQMRQIRQVLEQVDRMPRRLVISVRQRGAGSEHASGANVSGSVRAGGGRVDIGDASGGSRATARVWSSETARQSSDTYTIHVIEGGTAFIETGKSVPVRQRHAVAGPGGIIVSDSVGFRDVTSGFDVVPRLDGDIVTLQISPRREVEAGRGGASEVQRLHTTVSGRLGEWIPLGNAVLDDADSSSGVLSTRSASRRSAGSFEVRVEELR